MWQAKCSSPGRVRVSSSLRTGGLRISLGRAHIAHLLNELAGFGRVCDCLESLHRPTAVGDVCVRGSATRVEDGVAWKVE